MHPSDLIWITPAVAGLGFLAAYIRQEYGPSLRRKADAVLSRPHHYEAKRRQARMAIVGIREHEPSAIKIFDGRFALTRARFWALWRNVRQLVA